MRIGLGLIQAPRYRFARELANGSLVEILPNHPPSPTPLCALYARKRQMSARLRVFLDWLASLLRQAEL